MAPDKRTKKMESLFQQRNQSINYRKQEHEIKKKKIKNMDPAKPLWQKIRMQMQQEATLRKNQHFGKHIKMAVTKSRD